MRQDLNKQKTEQELAIASEARKKEEDLAKINEEKRSKINE